MTGVPEPLDCRLRDSIHGASEDLSAAQRVESRARVGRHGLLIDLRFHWRGGGERSRETSRAEPRISSWVPHGFDVRETPPHKCS